MCDHKDETAANYLFMDLLHVLSSSTHYRVSKGEKIKIWIEALGELQLWDYADSRVGRKCFTAWNWEWASSVWPAAGDNALAESLSTHLAFCLCFPSAIPSARPKLVLPARVVISYFFFQFFKEYIGTCGVGGILFLCITVYDINEATYFLLHKPQQDMQGQVCTILTCTS